MAVFERVAILGLGLLGGSVALAARRRGAATRVIGAARRPETLSDAIACGAIDEGCGFVEAVRGAVFFIRGDLLEKVGPLDEGYFFFLEETDYCWRVRAAGYRVLYCDTLRALHLLGASSKRRAPLATRIELVVRRLIDVALPLKRTALRSHSSGTGFSDRTGS